MAIIKCKMCGGDMVISDNKTYGTCEYCGSQMTLPKIDDDQRAAAFNRGNHFRRIGEFDKALQVYERIVREDENDAEAHWCCALSRFGIEYVKDPATYEYLPTCHRASFDNFLEDIDYLAAVEHSDGVTRIQYQKDGAKIAEVQRGILAASQNEKPYDVFLCYKETDEKGERTVDSVLAQEIYYQLTDQGRRVFFSRITLEDKAGTEYEPYIFAALNSAKVMVVVGTCAENLNAVWVKNEWSRFLAMMKHDRSKLLLPCYRDMDPYDMPQELSILQSYDMSRIGFIQDLIRGIGKVLNTEQKTPIPQPPKNEVHNARKSDPIVERGFLALEDGNWEQADRFFEDALNRNAECAPAYLGKAMKEAHFRTRKDIAEAPAEFFGSADFAKAQRFADPNFTLQLKSYCDAYQKTTVLRKNEAIYQDALVKMDSAVTEQDYAYVRNLLYQVRGYRDSDRLSLQCKMEMEKLRNQEQEEIYIKACKMAETAKGNRDMLEKACRLFESIPEWKDSRYRAEQIHNTQQKFQQSEDNYFTENISKLKKIKNRFIIAMVAMTALSGVFIYASAPEDSSITASILAMLSIFAPIIILTSHTISTKIKNKKGVKVFRLITQVLDWISVVLFGMCAFVMFAAPNSSLAAGMGYLCIAVLHAISLYAINYFTKSKKQKKTSK